MSKQSKRHMGANIKSAEGVDAITVADDGRVGIGTDNPNDCLLDVSGADGVKIRHEGCTLELLGRGDLGYAIIGTDTDHPLLFRTNNSERMRIDSDGRLLVGTTSAVGRLTIQGTGGTNYSAAISQDNSGGNVLGVFGPTNGTSQNFVVFAQAGNVKGTISTNGSTTSYNPSSDRRLKDNIQPLQNGLSSVMKLKPVTYNWKVTGDTDDGFIAQDLQGIPEFAHRVNPIGKAEDGSDLYGVDYMKFTAVLAAAIQEQQAMIEALKAEVAALKKGV